MERMGHSSITVTLDRYGHLLPSLEEHLTEALNRTGQAAAQRATAAGQLRATAQSRTNRARPGDRVPAFHSEIAPHQRLYESPRSASNRRPDAYKAPALAN